MVFVKNLNVNITGNHYNVNEFVMIVLTVIREIVSILKSQKDLIKIMILQNTVAFILIFKKTGINLY